MYIFIVLMLLPILNMKAYAGLEDIQGETPEEICWTVLTKPCRPAADDEDELRLLIAQKLLQINKTQINIYANKKSLDLLKNLLQIASNPPLRYDLNQYEKQWEEFAQAKNIKNPQNLKNDFFRKLKLSTKYSYLRNIFNQYKFEDTVFLRISNKNDDMFEACVREHIARMHNPETCQLSDVANYELEAEIFGLDKIYNFLMQPAIACQIELEACTHFIDSQVSQ